MARIVLENQIAASPSEVARALSTQQGIAGWWTDDVSFGDKVGDSMMLGFPAAPLPFELRMDTADESGVVWSSIGQFPPHWVGTTVIWSLTPGEGSTTVHFNHDGWASDEGPFPMAAYTWAQLLVTLKEHVETGNVVPWFTRAQG